MSDNIIYHSPYVEQKKLFLDRLCNELLDELTATQELYKEQVLSNIIRVC